MKIITDNQVIYNSSDTVSENVLRKEIEKLRNEFAERKITQCKCNNCGASLNVEYNKPIVICKYCNSTYIIGTARINDTN